MIDTDLPEYLAAAKGWETDNILRAAKSERRAWIVAGVAVFAAILAIGAVISLTPLKKVELRVVRVDKNTGYTDVVRTLEDDHLAYDDAKDEYWVSQYVEARERYSNEITGNDYVKVGLLSTPQIAAEYAASMDPANKESPLRVFGKNGKVLVHIVSVSLLGNGVAQVRFSKQERRAGFDAPPTNWIATVAYAYHDLKLTDEERRINMVGFQASDYRVASENVAATPAPRKEG